MMMVNFQTCAVEKRCGLDWVWDGRMGRRMFINVNRLCALVLLGTIAYNEYFGKMMNKFNSDNF